MAANAHAAPPYTLCGALYREITVLLVLMRNRSSLVESILVAAQQTKRGSFRVIIVDSRPGVEGRQLADTLSAEGIPCTYVLLTAISYIMRVRTSVDSVCCFLLFGVPPCAFTSCSLRYVATNSLVRFNPWKLQEVTKVFIGASAMMSNGAVLSRVGTVSLPLIHCSMAFTAVPFSPFYK